MKPRRNLRWCSVCGQPTKRHGGYFWRGKHKGEAYDSGHAELILGELGEKETANFRWEKGVNNVIHRK